MTPEEVPAALVEKATDNYLPGLYDTNAEAMRHALAAVLPEYAATVLGGAALHLRDVADEMDAQRPGNLLVGAAAGATRQDAAILDEIATRMRANMTEETP